MLPEAIAETLPRTGLWKGTKVSPSSRLECADCACKSAHLSTTLRYRRQYSESYQSHTKPLDWRKTPRRQQFLQWGHNVPAALWQPSLQPRRLIPDSCRCRQNALEESTAYAVAERLLRDSAIFLMRPGLPRGCMTIQTALAASDEGAFVHDELGVTTPIAIEQGSLARMAFMGRMHQPP